MQTISRSLLLLWYDYCWIEASLDQIWAYIHIRPSWSLQQPMSGHVGRRSTLLSQLHASNQMRSQNRASWWFFKVNKDDKRLWTEICSVLLISPSWKDWTGSFHRVGLTPPHQATQCSSCSLVLLECISIHMDFLEGVVPRGATHAVNFVRGHLRDLGKRRCNNQLPLQLQAHSWNTPASQRSGPKRPPVSLLAGPPGHPAAPGRLQQNHCIHN